MENKDIGEMIEVLSIAIVRGEAECEFFRRSAKASTSSVAKALFSEIAEELGKYRQSLAERRQKLLDALGDLKKAEDRGAKQ